LHRLDLAYLLLHDYSAYLQENVGLVDRALEPDCVLTVSEAIDWIRTQIPIALGFWKGGEERLLHEYGALPPTPYTRDYFSLLLAKLLGEKLTVEVKDSVIIRGGQKGCVHLLPLQTSAGEGDAILPRHSKEISG
jgi:hypothetical protein